MITLAVFGLNVNVMGHLLMKRESLPSHAAALDEALDVDIGRCVDCWLH